MLSGRKYLGEETDIWSLGVILYTLLCGGLPFDDDDDRAMKELILIGEYEEPEWLSQGTDACMDRLTTRRGSIDYPRYAPIRPRKPIFHLGYPRAPLVQNDHRRRYSVSRPHRTIPTSESQSRRTLKSKQRLVFLGTMANDPYFPFLITSRLWRFTACLSSGTNSPAHSDGL